MSQSHRRFWLAAAAVFLAAEWLWFGAMHFTLKAETMAQIPAWIPFKAALAWITGVWEVGTGLILLVPKWRRMGALSSLLILIAISPAIFHITVNPDPAMMPARAGDWFPLVVLPNAVLMAALSVFVWRASPRVSTEATPPSRP